MKRAPLAALYEDDFLKTRIGSLLLPNGKLLVHLARRRVPVLCELRWEMGSAVEGMHRNDVQGGAAQRWIGVSMQERKIINLNK